MKGFKDWINTHREEHNPEVLKGIWDASSSYKSEYRPNVEDDHANFMAKLREGEGGQAKVVSLQKRYRFLRVAAAVALLLVAGSFFNQYFSGSKSLDKVATLTEETKSLDLQDGTVVTLNRESELEFPKEFNAEKRIVELKGEGFFEVARDEMHPFVVETKEALVTVLGTSFNIRSYEQENEIEVFVKTGKVAVELKDSGKKYKLTPGSLLKLDDKTGEYRVVSDKENNTLAWKSGELRFTKQPMGKIFSSLEKLHHITIVPEDPDLVNCLYTFNPNTIDLKESFRGLEQGCQLKFSKTGKDKYLVTGSCCK